MLFFFREWRGEDVPSSMCGGSEYSGCPFDVEEFTPKVVLEGISLVASTGGVGTRGAFAAVLIPLCGLLLT